MAISDRITRHFALGVVVISALVMGYILHELRDTKEGFAAQLINRSSERIHSELEEFFQPVENMIMTLKQQQEVQVLQNLDALSLNHYFIPIISHYSQISSVGVADSRGYEFDILPDSTAGNWLNREVYVDKWGMTERWDRLSFRDSLSRLHSWESDLKVDPRDRSWFTGALKNDGKLVHWSEPYYYMTGELGITASIVWQSPQYDTLRHILALDITFKDIAKFSQNLKLTEGSQVYILTRNSEVISIPGNRKLDSVLLSSPERFQDAPFGELLKYPIDEIVSFQSQDKKWWGVVKKYAINPDQELLIAISIPESDFSYEIDSTRNAMITGFMVILLLYLLLVSNHNKLRRFGQQLNDKNNLITKQKERLFAEVHHRVKNNLAVMAALMELENMESENPAVKQVLTQTQRRVKSMSAVHEILYRSDDMNRVQVNEFVPGILNFSEKDFAKQNIELIQEIDTVQINVNQALTYALLLNEFMSSVLKAGIELQGAIKIRVEADANKLKTTIRIGYGADYLKRNRDVGKQLIQVLLAQLKADLEISVEEDFTLYYITFELKDKKGITSNFTYKEGVDTP